MAENLERTSLLPRMLQNVQNLIAPLILSFGLLNSARVRAEGPECRGRCSTVPGPHWRVPRHTHHQAAKSATGRQGGQGQQTGCSLRYNSRGRPRDSSSEEAKEEDGVVRGVSGEIGSCLILNIFSENVCEWLPHLRQLQAVFCAAVAEGGSLDNLRIFELKKSWHRLWVEMTKLVMLPQ